MTRPPRAALLVGLLVIVAGLSLSLRVAPYQVDDAYIFYRYAANIAAGHGPTFNAGSPPVEGFSSPLWTMFLALAAKLLGAARLPLAAMALGSLAYVMCVELVLRLGRLPEPVTSRLGNAACLLPAALWGLSPGATYYAVTGMDELLFVMVVLIFQGAVAGLFPAAVGIVAGFLATWARPEGPWLLMAGLAQLAAQRALSARWRRPGLMLVTSIVGGTLLVLGVRWLVFHDVLPNTFYAKRPSSELGLRYLRDVVRTPWSAAILAAGIAGGVVGRPVHRGFLAAGVAWFAAAIIEGGDWMPAFRLLQPALVLFALAAGGVGGWLERAAHPALVMLAALAAIVPLEVAATVERGDTALRSFRDLRMGARAMAAWFQSSGAKSIALIDVGEIGFACPDAKIVDLAGLTDRQVAHTGGRHLRKQIDPGYVLERRRPDVLLLRLWRLPGRAPDGSLAPRPEDALSQIEGDLIYDPRLLQLYRPLFVQAPPVVHEPLYARIVYVRRDAHLAPDAVPAADVVGFSP